MNKGFFSPEELSIIRGDETIKSHIKKPIIFNCTKCGLSNTCNSPKMAMTGKGKLGILICAEAPGQTEDDKGIQLVGKSGQLLRTIIKELGYELDRDFYKTNAIRCRPKNNATPTGIQINSCRKYLLEDIKKCSPSVIITLGKTAIDGLIGNRIQESRISGCSMTDWANLAIPDQELGLWIVPTWHPSYLLRQSKNGEVEDSVLRNQLKESIKNAIELSTQPFYTSNYLSDCIPIYDSLEAIKIIEDMNSKNIIAFDYETNGKKPFREGHKIYSISISDGLVSYAFPYFNDKRFRIRWLQLLNNSDVRKICHSGKFENIWSVVRGGYNDSEGLEINNLYWDTMLGGHSLYNNKKTGLKFYAYIHFGILGYDSEIDPYLEAIPQEEEQYGANAFNRIEEAPLDKVLTYNAMDSLITYKEYEYQKARLTDEQIKGVRFFTKGSMALSTMEQNGMHFDSISARKTEKNLINKLSNIESKVLKYPELKKWDKEKQFRISAPADITHLLFDILNYEIKDKTATGRAKSDIDALSKYKLPIVKDCLEWRRWQKVYNTYIKSLMRENNDGIIHASYNLNMVDSFRSSCSDPNMQNLPKHDEEVFKLLRKLIIPRENHKIAEYDYGSMEVRCIACYNKDPNLIEYINNPDTDMHRDMGALIYLRKTKDISSDDRYVAKNSFVFPTFYGSWYKNTSIQLWENCSKETRQHLKDSGIKNINDFTDHIQKIERVFWEDKFPVAKEWMDKTVKDFNNKGYMDSYTGFRYWGPLSNNQIFNFRIQGSGFHCLLWTLTQVTNKMSKLGLNSKIISEIHDSMIIDIDPSEEKIIDKLVFEYGTQKIREHWDWIIVPMIIEKSISEVNGNWSEMKTIGVLHG